jgi:hypothetical protein
LNVAEDYQADGQDRRKELREALIRASRRPESRSVRKLELRNVPLLAIVALAARCVRRVQPLFRTCYDDPRKDQLHRVIDMTVEATEAVAEGVRVPDMAHLGDLARQVSRGVLPPPADQVAYAAACAGDSAVGALAGEAENTIDGAATVFSVTANLVSFRNAVAGDSQAAGAELEKILCGQWADTGADEMRDALATDYEKLVTLDLGRFPEPGKTVKLGPEGPLGPLWPDDAPAWYEKMSH